MSNANEAEGGDRGSGKILLWVAALTGLIGAISGSLGYLQGRDLAHNQSALAELQAEALRPDLDVSYQAIESQSGMTIDRIYLSLATMYGKDTQIATANTDVMRCIAREDLERESRPQDSPCLLRGDFLVVLIKNVGSAPLRDVQVNVSTWDAGRGESLLDIQAHADDRCGQAPSEVRNSRVIDIQTLLPGGVAAIPVAAASVSLTRPSSIVGPVAFPCFIRPGDKAERVRAPYVYPVVVTNPVGGLGFG